MTYTVGGPPDAIVAGDFNGDGRTDLAVANIDDSDVSVLLGNGDGTFQNQMTYTVGGRPDAIVADDFNGDGWTDLAVANEFDTDVSVLLGNGDGTFQNQMTYTVGGGPDAIVAGDFNGDGRTDPAVGNIDDNDVSVLLNNGDGTFADPGQFSTTPHATPEVADLNGDGTDDVLVINAAGDILFRQGQSEDPGRFKPPVKVNPGFPARDIAYVVTRQGPVLAGVDARDDAVSLYVFRADGFVRIGSLPTGRLPAQIVSADLNGDGWDNLVVRNAGDGTLTVFFNNGSGSDATGNDLFPSSVTLLVGLGVSDVTLADVIHDGATDIIVTNKLSGQVSILHNRGDGTFDPPAALSRRDWSVRSRCLQRFRRHHQPRSDGGRGRGTVQVGRPHRPGDDQPRIELVRRARGPGDGPLCEPRRLPDQDSRSGRPRRRLQPRRRLGHRPAQRRRGERLPRRR